jgi:hypothetical protein
MFSWSHIRRERQIMHEFAKVGILIFLAIGLQAHSQQVQNSKTSGWLEYDDTTSGLSFRYPSSMRVREDTQSFKVDNPYGHIQKIVVLETKESVLPNVEPGEVLIFFIKDNGLFPERPWVETFETERKGCRSWRSRTIDGHRALECISCGSAACNLNIELFDPHRCTIMEGNLVWSYAAAEGDSTYLKLHDGRLPLLSIVNSVHFKSSK